MSERARVLREQAEEKLKNSNVQPSNGWLTSLDALSLLHKLASSPGSASDALKLLHELQVHQVELDLQHEQLEASERELTEDLVHCARLYDFAPLSYFSVSPQGEINRVNVAGAALCGEERAELIGRRIDDFLAPESRPVLEKLVAQVRNGVLDESCEVRTSAGAAFHVKAGLVPGESSILIIFVDVADSVKSAQSA
ncbi:MAG TPA: PAS domain-containing protein [Gammaproteobacteria bacterium]|nr:PAS domain-containing protein [Gammaproteobacteria bacterium]